MLVCMVWLNHMSKCFVKVMKHRTSGAYELAKEHETEFHDNPNYVTAFVLCHAQMALQPHEVETTEKEDSANFTTAMCHWSHAISYMASSNEILFSLYGN